MELLVQPGKALVPEQRNTQPGVWLNQVVETNGWQGDQLRACRERRSMEPVCGPGLVGRNRRGSQGQAKPCPHLQEPGSGPPV